MRRPAATEDLASPSRDGIRGGPFSRPARNRPTGVTLGRDGELRRTVLSARAGGRPAQSRNRSAAGTLHRTGRPAPRRDSDSTTEDRAGDNRAGAATRWARLERL